MECRSVGLRVKFIQCRSRRKLTSSLHNFYRLFLTYARKINEASNFFWALPINPPHVTINITEYWKKHPSFNIHVWYQHGHSFYNRESGKQEIYNSIKAGITQKLCSLMVRKDSYCLGTAQSRGLICAASKALQITIPSMFPPGCCTQQCSSGIHHQHRAGGAGAPPSPTGAAQPDIPSPGHGGGAAQEWTVPPAHWFVFQQQETKSRQCCKEHLKW